MTDKLVQTTAQIVNANKQVYSTITTKVSAPGISSNETNIIPLNTSVENIQILGTVINMGEEILPNPSLFKRINDSYRIFDGLKLNYKLTKLDTVSVLDTVSIRAIYRAIFAESKITDDSYKTFVLNKTLLENKVFIDVLNKSFNKSLVDTVSKNDSIKVFYNKNLLEIITNTEKLTLNYGKAVNNSITSTESITKTINFNRNFTEFVNATDDFYGLANLDDDQTVTINKVVFDWIASTEIQSIIVTITKLDQAITLEQNSIELAKPFSDSSNITDNKSLNTQKVFIDVSNSIDIKTFGSNKALLDINTTLDTSNKRATKLLFDILSTQEQASLTNLKPLSETFSISDTFIKVWQINRLIEDTVNSLDTLLRTDVVKALQSTASILDIPNVSITKIFADNLASTDILSGTVNYKRNLFDNISITDDFFGSANIDDDQIASVGKNNIEILLTSEQKTFDVAKLLFSSLASTDTNEITVTRPFVDTFNIEELTSVNTGKNLLENKYISESNLFDFNKTQIDILSLNEYIAHKNTKPIVDTVSFIESIANTPKKPFIDQTTSTDLITFFKFVNSLLTDITTTNDGGVINNQSYFATSYVEPGYVGTNTNFS